MSPEWTFAIGLAGLFGLLNSELTGLVLLVLAVGAHYGWWLS